MQNIRAFEILREAGFENISVDIIISVRNQKQDFSISEILKLKPEHISVYQLTIEENTLLYQKVRKGDYIPLSDEEQLQNYWKINEILKENGYNHYEISNYAIEPAYYSRHNLNYWNYGQYIGIGPGASGFLYNYTGAGANRIGRRWTNTKNIKEYFSILDKKRLPQTFTEDIDIKTVLKEFIMLGLRKLEGIEETHFHNFFGYSLFDAIKIESLQGFLEKNPSGIKLTHDGINVADTVIRKLWDLIRI